MVNTDIFLGSGASITFVPENDIYFGTSTTNSAAGSAATPITVESSFSNKFDLINDLYVGCLLEMRLLSDESLVSTHRITSNTNVSFQCSPTVNVNASTHYFVIKSYGAPCPAPKDGSGSTTHTASITTITFTSDTKTDYDDTAVVFQTLASEGAGSTTEQAIFIDHDASASYSVHTAPNVGEADISAAGDNTREEYAAIFTTAANALSNVSATRVGAVVTITNTHAGTNTASTITGLTGSATTDTGLTVSTVIGTTTAAGSTAKRLLSDEWLGILETGTFPTTEVEMKRTNLSLGGSRNYTYQYKGITSHSGGSLAFVANHGAWLYYFLGKCTQIECDTVDVTGTPTEYLTNASDKGKIFLEGDNGESAGAGVITTNLPETGPLFIRSIDDGSDGVLCPPVSPHLITLGDMKTLDRPVTSGTLITKPITYTFAEQDGDLLPSFALEQNLSKLATSSNKYRTNSANANEDLNFVKIARGNRVGDISITANENEEVKMTLNLFTRNVHTPEKTEVYDARRAVENETAFFNYETSANSDSAREPFFFSDGTFSVLGNSFLKINTLTLNMNNNLQDRRFLGVGNKNVQEAIPAQREYEISFTGHVTDDALYNALLEDSEETSQTISLVFTKANGEEINLTFTDYFISANNFPIPDDKGPLVVEATVLPRNLGTCTVKTHWVLQG